jgi:DNA-binding transcriptional regulator YiaG
MTRANRRCERRAASPERRRPVTNTTCAPKRKAEPTHQAVAKGTSIAGAVLRSARRSARTSQATLAAACGVTANSIRAWEDGSSPLTSVPMPQMDALIAALHDAGACRLLTADLTVAAWCDLIIAGVANSEDVTSLLADPTTTEEAFGQLMAWCLKGHVPRRYRPYADGRAIVTQRALIERIRQAME